MKVKNYKYRCKNCVYLRGVDMKHKDEKMFCEIHRKNCEDIKFCKDSCYHNYSGQ